MTSAIDRRKSEHIDIVLNRTVASAANTGLEHIRFVHDALPDFALSDIDLKTQFLSRTVKAPLIVSSMTGGPERAASINISIAEACQENGIGFGVGSQRIALETESHAGFDRSLRDRAPDVPILANFGAAQLRQWEGSDMARRAVDMIDADALVVHLNPLQEAVQAGGDTDWSGTFDSLEKLVATSDVPIVVKEVGFGISRSLARRLTSIGVSTIDVAGAGGTNWATVEAARAPTPKQAAIAAAFSDWGIPTATAVKEVRDECPNTIIIASGGIRDGIDIAKSIRLGADLAGMAASILKTAIDGPEALSEQLAIVIEQLRVCCFVTGCRDLKALRTAPVVSAAAPRPG